jgi:hypothetical protein
MSRLILTTTTKVLLAAGAVLLVTGGAIAGVAGAGVAGATSAAAPKLLDHQLCYTASAKGFKVPKRVLLKDQLSPHGFVPKIGPVALHCNPVEKIVLPGKKIFPIVHPAAHLVCFMITEPKQRTPPAVVVTNQFGTGAVVPGQPDLLCLPSWKSLTGPPRRKRVQPPDLSHFTCYPVYQIRGLFRPPAVLLKDEFAGKPVPAKVNPVPVLLCLPTQKTVAGRVYKAIYPGLSLLCFPVSKTPIRPRVFDENQFGTSVVLIHRTALLCLPSSGRPDDG